MKLSEVIFKNDVNNKKTIFITARHIIGMFITAYLMFINLTNILYSNKEYPIVLVITFFYFIINYYLEKKINIAEQLRKINKYIIYDVIINNLLILTLVYFDNISTLSALTPKVASVYFIMMALSYGYPDYKIAMYSNIVYTLFGLFVYNINYFNYDLTVYKALGFDTAGAIQYSLLLIFSCIIITFLVFLRDGKNNLIKKIVNKRLISDAHYNLLLPNGERIIGNWLIKSQVIFSDEIIGGDFIGLQYKNNKIKICIGDIISHGLDVSPGMLAAMAAFHSNHSFNISSSINSIHNALELIDPDSGGEGFCSIAICEPDGTIKLGGNTGSTSILMSNVAQKKFDIPGFILGKDDFKITDPLVLHLEKHESVILMTDGVENLNVESKNDKDDKTFCIIEYLGEKQP